LKVRICRDFLLVFYGKVLVHTVTLKTISGENYC